MKAFWAKITAFFMTVVAFFTGLFGAGGSKPVDPPPEPTSAVVQPTEPSTEATPTYPLGVDVAEGPRNTRNANAIHQLKSVTDTIGDGYIITTEDGKVIVIDGGYKTETDYFLSYLQTVTGQEKPHVDYWFLTHPHNDHCQVFFEVVENRPDALTFDVVSLKFAPAGYYVGIDSEAEGNVQKYLQLQPLFAEKEQTPADGDQFHVGAAQFTMLYTFDSRFTRCNESSLVFRMDLGGKSVLFTGDMAVNAEHKILDNQDLAPLLRCDICKMAHHGQDAVDSDFYVAVAPQICLWPTPSWLWTNNNGTGPYTTLETRQWIENLGVRLNLVKMDGSRVLYLNPAA